MLSAHVEQRVNDAREQLDQALQQAQVDDMELQLQEKQLTKKQKFWLKVEESVYQQKSRVDWLRLGDSNTSFFFSAMKQRYQRNRIDTIYDENENFLNDR